MNTLGDVKSKMRALLGDPDGDWLSDGYITPLIDITYGAQYIYIKNACGQNLEKIALVANLPAGTTSLLQSQATGKPLDGLYSPLEVWAKPAGTPVNYFRKYTGPRPLPHIPPPGAPLAGMSVTAAWDWVGNQLLVTPVAVAIDIEVRGRFNPPALTQDDQVLVVDPSMWVATAFGAAAVAGVERSNQQILEGYATAADAACDNIAAELTRQLQGNPARTGRMDRNMAGYYGWRWTR